MGYAQVRRMSIAALVVGVVLTGCTSKESSTATSAGRDGDNPPATRVHRSTSQGSIGRPIEVAGPNHDRAAGQFCASVGTASWRPSAKRLTRPRTATSSRSPPGRTRSQSRSRACRWTLLGGFSADFSTRNPEAEETVVDAGGKGSTVSFSEAGDSTIDGFTITGGKAILDEWGSGFGSGIRVTESGAVTISRNLVEDNDDGQNFNTCNCEATGGGISVTASTAVTIADNIVRNNSSIRGGGLDVQSPRSVIERNLVEDNHGRGDHGGGLYLAGDGMVLRGNLIRGNTIGDQAGYGWGGGGIFYGEDVAEKPAVRLEGNRWVGNVAPGKGSGFFLDEAVAGTIVGDLYYANTCSEGGAGLYVDGGGEFGSTAAISNVTITGSECGDEVVGSGLFAEGGSRFDLTESIVAGNGGVSDVNQCDFCTDAPAVTPGTVTNSIVGGANGAVEVGEGVEINDSPEFVDPENGDFSVEGTTWGA